MGIDVKQFLSKVEEIVAEEPSYRHGGYGKDGTCDCIGLIIGAIRRAGGTWSGTHGSNYAARNEIVSLEKINGTNSLRVGDAVFKAYEPGESKYGLPSRYSSSPDQRNYYHVGVVVSVSPLRIRHMTTPKPKTDTKLGKWSYHGQLKKVSGEQTGGGVQVEMAAISGGNLDSTINMRGGPGKNYKITYDIPQGSAAEVIEDKGDWMGVSVNGHTGWVMKEFVHVISSGVLEDEPVGTEASTDTITVSRKELEKIYDLLGDLLGLRG